MYNIHFVTLPNGEIVKVEFWGGSIVTRGGVDLGGYVDTDSVREMSSDEWRLLRSTVFRKPTAD